MKGKEMKGRERERERGKSRAEKEETRVLVALLVLLVLLALRRRTPLSDQDVLLGLECRCGKLQQESNYHALLECLLSYD